MAFRFAAFGSLFGRGGACIVFTKVFSGTAKTMYERMITIVQIVFLFVIG